MLRRANPASTTRKPSRWLAKIMAAIALINFLLVLLDYSYIPLRDNYLHRMPDFTSWYGEQFKGIVPDRTTTTYLETVEQLKRALNNKNGVDPLLLASLRQQSRTIINENPFELADKTGTLERIKRRMIQEVSETSEQEIDSAKEAFDLFWSQEYLDIASSSQIVFFETKLKPLLETNYYRHIDTSPLSASGRPVDHFFWRIEMSFAAFFFGEFLLRTAILSRRHPNTSWLDAMLWRWYDVFLFLPFLPIWRWLMTIPVTIRINQSRFANLEPLRNRLTRGMIASVAVELTEVVILRVIDQLQNMIRDGQVRRSLLNPETGLRYVDLNGIDEIQLITERLTSTLLNDVLPKVQPDIEQLLQHTIQSVLVKNSAYSQLQLIPGVSSLSTQLASQLSTELYNALYQTLTDIVEDEKGAELTQSLVSKIGDTFRSEIQQDQGIEELESLVTIWLDEVKINYVQQLAGEDIDSLREETQKIYAITQQSSSSL